MGHLFFLSRLVGSLPRPSCCPAHRKSEGITLTCKFGHTGPPGLAGFRPDPLLARQAFAPPCRKPLRLDSTLAPPPGYGTGLPACAFPRTSPWIHGSFPVDWRLALPATPQSASPPISVAQKPMSQAFLPGPGPMWSGPVSHARSSNTNHNGSAKTHHMPGVQDSPH